MTPLFFKCALEAIQLLTWTIDTFLTYTSRSIMNFWLHKMFYSSFYTCRRRDCSCLTKYQYMYILYMYMYA